MKAVGVKVLKAKLSEYLRLVKAGETVLVTERDEVVAELSLSSAVGALTAKSLALPVELYDPDKNFAVVRDKWIGFGTAE